MARKDLIRSLFFKISRESRWALMIGLMTGLLLATSAKDSCAMTQAASQSENAERAFKEAELLSDQKTAESRRQSILKYEEAIELWRASGNPREAVGLTSLGVVYSNLGEEQKAIAAYSRALPIYRAAHNPIFEMVVLNNLGNAYSSVGEPQKAIEHYEQALALSRKFGSRFAEAGTLTNLSEVYSIYGEIQKALDYLNQALAIFNALGKKAQQAILLHNMAFIHDLVGEKQQALDRYNQALQIRRAVGDRQGEAFTLNGLGGVYGSLGETRQALEYFNQAISLWRVVGDRRGEAVTLNSIGQAYFKLGDSQKALAYYGQSLELSRVVGDRHGEATTLNNFGVAYKSLRDYQRALDYLGQSLQLRRTIGDRRGEAMMLHNIGGVHSGLKAWQQAFDNFQQALPLSQRIGDRGLEASILYNLAGVERERGNLLASRTRIESALELIESLRVKIASQELRASYFATVQDCYEFRIALLMQLHSQNATAGYNTAALQASEQARARSLLELLAEARADIRVGVSPALVARERQLQQQLNTKAARLLQLKSNDQMDSRAIAVEKDIDALTTEFQQVQAQIRQTSPRYAALTQPQPLSVPEIQRQVLDADTLLLEYSLGDERSFLWAVTPTSINSYELPKREVIEVAAQRVYNLLTSPSRSARGETDKQRALRQVQIGEEYSTAVAELGRMLLAPVAGQLGRKRLVIVADGALHILPFGALPDPNEFNGKATNWQPLIVEHEVVNLPSASTLAVLRRELAGRKPAAKALAVLADPVFAKDDVRIKPSTRRTEQPINQTIASLSNERITRKLIQLTGGNVSEMRIARLPFTRQEAEQLLALVPASAGMKALDFQASRATAMSDQLSQYRYLHFATHGLADSERAELSTIVLSLVDEQGAPQEGFLRAHEVYNLNLPAELVVLSACETGLGKQVKGEGLVSLTRGFMYAGAARVVVSLWSVNDKATAELMTKFYRKILIEGQRPAGALRAAQIAMWHTTQWAAPYYWAAFTLQGEWR